MDALSMNTKIDFSGDVKRTHTSITRSLGSLTKKFVKKISLAYAIYEERRELRNLSDEMLNDLGVSRGDINKECDRSFFDTPDDRH